MDGTQYRVMNQMQVIQNFCHIRMKTVNFLLQPYDISLLDNLSNSMDEFANTLNRMTEHSSATASGNAARRMQQRGLGVFQRHVAEQLNLLHLSLEDFAETIQHIEFEPWERGIANQMLRHLQNLLVAHDRLLEDLTHNHWYITNALGDNQ